MSRPPKPCGLRWSIRTNSSKPFERRASVSCARLRCPPTRSPTCTAGRVFVAKGRASWRDSAASSPHPERHHLVLDRLAADQRLDVIRPALQRVALLGGKFV